MYSSSPKFTHPRKEIRNIRVHYSRLTSRPLSVFMHTSSTVERLDIARSKDTLFLPHNRSGPTEYRWFMAVCSSFFRNPTLKVPVVVVVVVFTLKAVPVSAQYFLTSVLVQLTRTPSVVTG